MPRAALVIRPRHNPRTIPDPCTPIHLPGQLANTRSPHE
jgi:hypothetical protein